MASLGEKLKEARLKQGLSLDEIAGKTRIQAQFLDAIEQDNLEKIPGDFFRKSFVRQYATTLGLDPDEFETTTEIQFGSFGSTSSALQEKLSMPEQPDLPPLPTIGGQSSFSFRQVFLSVGLLIGVIAVCAVAYMIWEDSQTRERNVSSAPEATQTTESPSVPVAQVKPEVAPESPGEESTTAPGPSDSSPGETSPPVEPGPATPPATLAPLPVTPPATAATPASGEVSPAPTVHGSGERELRLSASALTWVRVRDGEKTVYVGTIDAGQSRVIRVGANAQILTGNAGGLSVVWQGSDVGKIGPVGQVRTVTLTPEGASIQAPAPKTPTEGHGTTGSSGSGGSTGTAGSSGTTSSSGSTGSAGTARSIGSTGTSGVER